MAAYMAFPDTVIQICFCDSGVDELLSSELPRNDSATQGGQCLDVPYGRQVIPGCLRENVPIVGERIECYEIIEVHQAKNSMKPSQSAAKMPPMITA